ncbi:MAG: hypothetical protein NTW29_00110 [Bacteroidetes bacterium]|nr:hypothetical protein [Bacteroidota bacterium]
MKRLRHLLLLPFVLIHIAAFACGNEFYRSEIPLDRKKLRIEYLLHDEGNVLPYWSHGFGYAEPDGRWDIIEKMKKAGIMLDESEDITWPMLQSALQRKKDYKLLSDFAWHEVRTGDREMAVKLLEALYKEHPTEYNILANLGTAYEVIGKPAQALELLRKAVAINPASHFGSEWIHIRILEQKVAAKPDYRLIIDLKPGSKNDKPIPPDSLMVQLAYQLHERISFIAPPDPIVGQLVKDFADLVAMQQTPKQAQEFYAYAAQYDSTVLLQKPVAEAVVKETVQTKKNSDSVTYITTWLLVIIGVVIAGVVVYKINRSKQRNVAGEKE